MRRYVGRQVSSDLVYTTRTSIDAGLHIDLIDQYLLQTFYSIDVYENNKVNLIDVYSDDNALVLLYE